MNEINKPRNKGIVHKLLMFPLLEIALFCLIQKAFLLFSVYYVHICTGALKQTYVQGYLHANK